MKLGKQFCDSDFVNVRKKIGLRIAKRVKEKGVHLYNLEVVTGTSRYRILSYMRGMTCPTVFTLCKLARALNVDLDYFFQEVNIK